MWESRVLQRAFERLELHEGKLSRAVLRGGGGGDVTSLPDAGVGNHPGLPGPEFPPRLGLRLHAVEPPAPARCKSKRGRDCSETSSQGWSRSDAIHIPRLDSRAN